MPKHTKPQPLMIIPFFPGRDLLDRERQRALKVKELFRAELLRFANCEILSGFVGYPYLEVLLRFMPDWRHREIYFLGTAGFLGPEPPPPTPLQLDSISADPAQFLLSEQEYFTLKPFPAFPAVPGVSVDLPGRENDSWLAEQRRAGRRVVEMEIYALAALYGRPLTALVALSDYFDPGGANRRRPAGLVEQEFELAYTQIRRLINERQGDPDPAPTGRSPDCVEP